MSLVQMTLSGGAFILFIVVVRALALHRLPKGAFLALWEMAALRLLLPFAVPLPLAVRSPVERLPVVGGYLAAGGASVSVTPGAGAPAGVPVAAAVDIGAVLRGVWLAGAVLAAAYFAVCYVRARRRFCRSTPDNSPAVERWLAEQTLRRPLAVRQSPLAASPLTYGIFRPVILLPAGMGRDDESALRYVLTHELVHIRRFDALAKLLFAAALCVHWFNPLVWVLYVLANRDMELSCDARVMDLLGAGERAAYALTLIDMEETRSRGLSLYSHFSKLAIEERIEAIMKYKKASVLALALAAALVIGTTTAFAVAVQPDAALTPGGQSGTQQPANDGSLLPGAQKAEDDSTLSSYTDPKDGKTYYSFDGGKTWQPLTDEELALRFPAPRVEWWTEEEYAAWLEKEKVELQAMLGEKGWTGTRGEFVWTQEIIDETIAIYERILQEIREGKLYSKSVDGDTESLLISGGAGDIFVREEDGTVTPIDPSQVQTGYVFDGSTSVEGGSFTIEKAGIASEDWDVVKAPRYTEEEQRQIIDDIESGKLPPLELPDDPNVTVRFVEYPSGDCTEKI